MSDRVAAAWRGGRSSSRSCLSWRFVVLLAESVDELRGGCILGLGRDGVFLVGSLGLSLRELRLRLLVAGSPRGSDRFVDEIQNALFECLRREQLQMDRGITFLEQA